MSTPPLSDEVLIGAVEAFRTHGAKDPAARALGLNPKTFRYRLKLAAERGLLLGEIAMPGFRVAQVTDGPKGRSVVQKPEHGEAFELPEGHVVKGVSAYLDPDDRVVGKWVKTALDAERERALLQDFAEGLRDNLPRAKPVSAPKHGLADLLCQYTVTDLHLAMRAWGEEAGADYDLAIGEQLLIDFFGAAIAMAPNASTAVLAQLGDWHHVDSNKALTPEHGHLLDADTRFPKLVRTSIRLSRWMVGQLLKKHGSVYIVWADANHDPTSAIWIREMLAMFYANEPRVTVDTNPGTYYCYEHGLTSLFYHHGHKKKNSQVDSVFAGQYRDVFGRTKYSYAHVGHLHSDELITTNLMKVERHETLAAKDAFAASSGYPGGRSAKVITYSKRFGEVSRITLTPEMVVDRGE